jgi:hypothetical protein
MKKLKKNELTTRIDQFLSRDLNIYLNDGKWSIEEVLQEVYDYGKDRGRREKTSEFKDMLGIKE